MLPCVISRVDVGPYLLIVRLIEAKQWKYFELPSWKLESFCFTFDLVPFSCGKRLYCLVEESLREDDPDDTKEEKMYMKFYQQRGRLSRCGRKSNRYDPILALPEGANVSYIYDARDKDLEAVGKRERFCTIMLEALSERNVESDLYGS
ncbi:hypothetical protein Tco_1524199 [Tanacetum coccineum]